MTWQWRVVDVASAGFGLVVLSPLWVIVGILIKLDSPGPVLHRSVRIGKYGKPFRIYKFRTMVADAAQRGAGITSRDDPRITRVGKVLRRTKVDELPQLINVLRGEMSLVGPRPEDPRYLQYYTPAQRAVLDVRPGITSAASLAFRHEEQLLSGTDWEQIYIHSVLPQKLDIELAYLQRRTFWSDLGIVAQTALAVVSGGTRSDAT